MRDILDLAQREPGLTSLVLMAIAGIGIAGYLTVVHYTGGSLACPTTGVINCQAVTSSAYSVVLGTGIPITIPGILWFLVSGGLASTALVRVWQGHAELPRLRLAQALWGAAGLLFVLYLVYAEIVLLHFTFCEWCTVVHLLTLATFLVALKRWQDTPSGRARPRATGAPAARSAPHGAATPGAGPSRAGKQHTRSRAAGRAR